ncbi:hypothetical protein HJO_03885 [Hyphomonas johnsonii MHS-2]|uniref:Uncharacterized protein n=2 Tax=Hyphomonas johnsonii TaxID=81031 RepID=A0A059FUX6_9PROT|nr:hypothetical protein HJO_03885 [Hyphomonas johnsonii MHS-2]
MVPCLLFAGVFVVCAASISTILRHRAGVPEMSVLSPKLAAYQSQPDAYDTLFVGTSRTFYHIVPEVIESSAAEYGCPDLRVFNFGVFGLTGAEQDWLVDQILDAGQGHLRAIVLEDPLPEARATREATSTRARFFNSTGNAGRRIASIMSYPESIAKKVYRIGVLGYGMAYDLSGVGRAATVAFPAAVPDVPETLNLSQDGFEALGSVPTDDILARHKDFEDNPAKFADALARYGAPSNEKVEPRAVYIASRIKALEARGINAALYISPDPLELDRTPRVGEAVRALMPETTVIDLNRPDEYPDLFERGIWFDFSHVGEEGARRLSRHAGQELCEGLKQGRRGVTDAVR